jgi:hypothetical protein
MEIETLQSEGEKCIYLPYLKLGSMFLERTTSLERYGSLILKNGL